MSTEKKLTPLQEAIKDLIYKANDANSYTLEERSGFYKATDVLESLLPKEKEFARDMFDAGVQRGLEEGDKSIWIYRQPTFEKLFKQYEQS